jgi:hypothetical protein
LCPRDDSQQAYRKKKLYDPHGLCTALPLFAAGTKNLSIPILTLEVSHPYPCHPDQREGSAVVS